VIDPVVVEGDPPGVFDRSALKAIVRWRFRPALKDGMAVGTVIVTPLKFDLPKRD